MSGNPYKHFFRFAGFDEELFVGESGLNYERNKEFGFEEFKEDTGGFVVYRKPNDLGGYDYLPFVGRWFPGNMPASDFDKDRWLEGYDCSVVLFVMGEPQKTVSTFATRLMVRL